MSLSKKRLAFFATGVLCSLVICGCKHNNGVIYSSDSATRTKLITFDAKNARYLATKWANDQQDRSAARDADEEESVDTVDSLVAVVENANGELETKNVMDFDQDELKLADWCVPAPVREVYKCPYSTVEDEAKGFYTIFAYPISWWQYENGSPAPNVGQVMYVKPDGSVMDILNFDNDVNRWASTWIKENDGEEYIQFDENGNIFILTSDDTAGKTVIYRYNPMNDRVDGYTLNVTGDVQINNFRITRDGKWIFLNVMLRHQENNVYAMQVNANTKPITMYKFTGDIPEPGEDPQWAVSSIEINPTTNEVYWYVCEYLDDTRSASGLYVASRSTNGQYSADRVKRYYSTPKWCFDNARRIFLEDQNLEQPDYKGFLDYLKGMCNCDKKDAVFTTEYFKDLKEEVYWNEEYYLKDFSPLYKEDENGDPLTDEKLLEYLYTTTDYYENGDNNNLLHLFDIYFDDFWRYKNPDEDWNHSMNGYVKEGYQNGNAFPWEKILINKKTGEPAVDVVFGKAVHSQNEGGIILANDEGMWVLSDIWNNDLERNTHSIVYKITDERGNFVTEQPSALNGRTFYTRSDEERQRKDGDPWYKKPFAANTSGIAILSLDKTTVYYHSEEKTQDLLENDPNQVNIKKIYAFTLQDDKLIYNAMKKDGSYMMVSVDLETKEAQLLPLEGQVESMLGF